MIPMLKMMAGLGGVNNDGNINLTDHNLYRDALTPALVTVTLRLQADGDLETVDQNGTTDFTGTQWLTGGTATDYEAMFLEDSSAVSFTGASNAVDTWIALGSGTVYWSITNATPDTTKIKGGVLSIRLASTGAVQATSRVDMEAEVYSE